MGEVKFILYRCKRIIQQPKKFAKKKLYPIFISKFIVPFVLKEKIENVLYSDFAFSNFHILTHDTFYKIASFGSTLEEEFKNREILNAISPLNKFIPKAKRIRRFGFNILSTKKLEHLNDENEIQIASDNILTALRSLGVRKLIKVEDLPNLMNGLAAIRKIYGGDLANGYLHRLERILSKALYIGPTHGDFHQGNILKDAIGTPQLIDWDCYESAGIQALDALAFIVLNYCKKNNCNYYSLLEIQEQEQWESMAYSGIFAKFVDIPLSDISFLFLINMVGIETRYYKLGKVRLNEIDLLVQKLALKDSPIYQ